MSRNIRNNLDDFSVEELQEMVHQLEDELEYEKENVSLLYNENKTLKSELYSLVPRVEVLESYKEEIQGVLDNQSMSCVEKVQNISATIFTGVGA